MNAVLMIDLKQSRKYDLNTREDIQRFIYAAIGVLNDIFYNSLERASEFSAGDEIQGLFKTPAAAYLYYRLFSMLIHPVKIRAGIGVGTWDIRIDGGGTTAQDGQVYHRARKAITNADEMEGYSVLYYSESCRDTVINSLIGGAAETVSSMNGYQNDFMLLSELLSPINADDAADISKMVNLCSMVREKRKISFFETEKTVSNMFSADLDPEKLVPSPVEAISREECFYVTGGKTRGLPVKIAGILGITRQSVERTLKTANVFTARNMAISAIKAMMAE